MDPEKRKIRETGRITSESIIPVTGTVKNMPLIFLDFLVKKIIPLKNTKGKAIWDRSSLFIKQTKTSQTRKSIR